MRRRLAAALIALSLAASVGACAPAGERQAAGLDVLLVERDRAVLELHQETVDRVAGFLRNTWGPVILPEESIIRLVTGAEWGPAVARCIATLGFPGVGTADGGERLDFSGVQVSGPRENFEIDVATYRCYVRYPVRTRIDEGVRQVESPWAYAYTASTQLPCLAADGHVVPSLPSRAEFAERWRTDEAFDAYAAIVDPRDRLRATQRCPAPLTVLNRALEAPDDSQAARP
jgi:hypothetical protein